MRDSFALTSAECWKRFAQEVSHPFAEVNILVIGAVANAALLTVQVKQSVRETSSNTIACRFGYSSYSIKKQPLEIALTLGKAEASTFGKWTSDEVSQIFQLPLQSDYFIGIERNAFSLMPETELLSEHLTYLSEQSLCLGKSVFFIGHIPAI